MSAPLAGLAGLLVATLAIMVPSCSLAFLVGRMITRWGSSRAVLIVKAAWLPVAWG